ncbi:uncharacterized protein LOC133202890 [Saccostrea echinata]|uniref:uncharacterized protein LOC133202890 n=1 Tax=Saccostrea echinata TaxID=191078 RepID=UPI002A82ECE3|nr:uncharacterized protein LOC133202890 [Saccostrea echinata]
MLKERSPQQGLDATDEVMTSSIEKDAHDAYESIPLEHFLSNDLKENDEGVYVEYPDNVYDNPEKSGSQWQVCVLDVSLPRQAHFHVRALNVMMCPVPGHVCVLYPDTSVSCTRTRLCPVPGHVCVLDVSVPGGQICGASHARRKRQLVICTDCCSDAPDIYGPCNSKLCGLTPTTENYECLVCAGVLSDVNSCSTTSVCPPREACFSGIRIVGTAIRYVVGCYDERVCHAIVENDGRNGTHGRRGRVIHGDQGTRICDACCKGDRCNAAGCFELRKNMTAAEYSNSLGPAFG